MCEKFSKSPCSYLYNDPPAIHDQLAIDMTVFNVWSDYVEEERKKQERNRGLKNASS